MKDWHGTATGYFNHRCRCDRCRKAHSDYYRAYRARLREEPVPEHVHGTVSGYTTYGCRCTLCGKAQRISTGRSFSRPYLSRAEARAAQEARKAQRAEERRTRRDFDSHWVEDEAGCWAWQGIRVWQRTTPRRFSYERSVAPIPEHRFVTVTCGNALCVNPMHLTVPTLPKRKATGSPRPQFAIGSLCSNGHLLTADTVRIRAYDGHRECVQCNRDRSRRYRDGKRLAA